VVICLQRGADLHMAQLMPLPLTVSCSGKIQIGVTFLPAHLGSPGQRAVKSVCVCVCVYCMSIRRDAVLANATLVSLSVSQSVCASVVGRSSV